MSPAPSVALLLVRRRATGQARHQQSAARRSQWRQRPPPAPTERPAACSPAPCMKAPRCAIANVSRCPPGQTKALRPTCRSECRVSNGRPGHIAPAFDCKYTADMVRKVNVRLTCSTKICPRNCACWERAELSQLLASLSGESPCDCGQSLGGVTLISNQLPHACSGVRGCMKCTAADKTKTPRS